MNVLITGNQCTAAAEGSAAEVPGGNAPSSFQRGDGAAMDPAGPVSGDESAEHFTFGRRLRRARLAKQWSQLQLVYRMREVAKSHHGTARVDSLMIMMSKWENDRKRPNQYNLHLLAASLDIPVEALGLPVDPDFQF